MPSTIAPAKRAGWPDWWSVAWWRMIANIPSAFRFSAHDNRAQCCIPPKPSEQSRRISSLPPRRRTIARLRRRVISASDRRRLDEHIHLLPHINRQAAALEAVENLKHARVHALAALAGQRFLGHHERLDPHEMQRRGERR